MSPIFGAKRDIRDADNNLVFSYDDADDTSYWIGLVYGAQCEKEKLSTCATSVLDTIEAQSKIITAFFGSF